jgi:predicted acyltransferase
MHPSFSPRTRWRALDVFRGLAILGMILVNASDLGGHAYPWLRHAQWNGCKFADSVFPAFLFIMGVAMGISIHGSIHERLPLRQIYPRIVRRSVVLFVLGLILNGMFAHGLQDWRVMGVLQRLGLCYLLVAVILLHLSARAQLLLAAVILIGYWLALALLPVPLLAHDPSLLANNLPAYIDRWLLGRAHLLGAEPYTGRLDPEGVLGTLPTLVNVLLGALAGRLIAASVVGGATTCRLAAWGAAGSLVGLAWGLVFPINKALWTSSFVLLTSGLAALGLAVCYELVDVRGLRGLGRPFEVLGVNAIAAYLASSVIDALMLRLHVAGAGETQTVYEYWLSVTGLPVQLGAFAFALLEALLVSACAYAMQARGWFIKI